MKFIRLFIQLSRPLYLLSATLLYMLSVSVARYLSGSINWSSLILGLVWITLTLLAGQYLNEYFDPSALQREPVIKHTPFSGGSGAVGESKLTRPVALWVGLAFLTVATSLTIYFVRLGWIGLPGITIFGLIILAEFFYAVPPFRLVSSGYGELILTAIQVGMVPALGFLLQGRDFHRLLIMVVFPLTPLFLGSLLAMEFPDYGSDLAEGKRPIIVRTGWQRAMLIHNLLILSGFVLLGIGFAFGLPLRIGWPVLFVLPIGLFQIWMMNRIGDGAKPNWKLLILVAISTFGITAYLLTFAFLTH